MKKATKFADLYKDSRWQQKRLEIMERDGWECQSCYKSGEGVTLNVHHAYYESGKKPWEYSGRLLVTWCQECHNERHGLMRNINVCLAHMDFYCFMGLYYMLCISGCRRLLRLMERCWKKNISISDNAIASCLLGMMRQSEESKGDE